MTFEEWFMRGVKVDPDFDRPVDFENCARYINTSLSRASWDYQQAKLDEAMEVIEFYGDTDNWNVIYPNGEMSSETHVFKENGNAVAMEFLAKSK